MVYITYNIGMRDLPVYMPTPLGLGIYIKQIPCVHVITIKFNYIAIVFRIIIIICLQSLFDDFQQLQSIKK